MQVAESKPLSLSSTDTRAAITLAVLAPVIAELLTGSTRVSFAFVLVPEIMVWGCGALLAREAVRRWRGGWMSLMLLGIALGVAEECVIQQTSLAPLVGLDPAHAYGRFFGVNWVWMVGLLVFETVWVVLVPVEFIEALFPEKRREPWLSNTGILVSSLLFVVGSFIAWFMWTRIARPMKFHVPPYHPPLSDILAGVAAIGLLAGLSFLLSSSGRADEKLRGAAGPMWLAAVIAFLFAAPWFTVIGWAYGSMPRLPVWIAIWSALIYALIAFLIYKWWTSRSGWGELHSVMAASGALLASMIMGFVEGNWSKVDLIGKIVLDLAAVLGMIYLAAKTRARTSV
ncbi:MAG TPA: hypothetical protein VJQ59_13220 [Candidatus Sulfotelmatobacter sp.]|nr:hypothetical protein [Candidatus Sulfotelmatobacter sp.]